MEYNHNEQHASEDEKSARSPLGNIRTPSSFFPVELSRLGLDNGSTPSSSQVNGLIAHGMCARRQHSRWEDWGSEHRESVCWQLCAIQMVPCARRRNWHCNGLKLFIKQKQQE